MSVRHCPYNMKLFLASVSAQRFYFVLIFFGGWWVAVLSSMWDLSSSTSKVWSLNHWTFRKIPQIFFKANDGFKEYTSQTLCSQLFFFKKSRICIGRGTKRALSWFTYIQGLLAYDYGNNCWFTGTRVPAGGHMQLVRNFSSPADSSPSFPLFSPPVLPFFFFSFSFCIYFK